MLSGVERGFTVLSVAIPLVGSSVIDHDYITHPALVSALGQGQEGLQQSEPDSEGADRRPTSRRVTQCGPDGADGPAYEVTGHVRRVDPASRFRRELVDLALVGDVDPLTADVQNHDPEDQKENYVWRDPT